MPLVLLPPGKSIELAPNTNEKDPDAVSNPNPVEGKYTTRVPPSEVIMQRYIRPHGYQPFLSPEPNGIIIGNNGKVELTIKTPGL